MPLAELDALIAGLDDRGRSPIADAVAAAWSYPAGTARFWRSSACHVFVIDGPPRRYLRFVPVAVRRLDAVAKLMGELAGAGAAVVAPVTSRSGRRCEVVATGPTEMSAMLVEAAPGVVLDVDDLRTGTARAWGASLAALHLAAAERDWIGEERHADLADRFDRSDPLRAVVQADLAELSRQPDGPDRFGLGHGDYELDNLAWQGNRPTAFDLDEATRSWYAADVAYAMREVTDPTLTEAFLAGYQTVRPLDRANLPLFHRLQAARSVATVEALLAAHPDAAAPLRDRLADHVRRQRAVALSR
jgi:Ser/Thr protein kinase RdoA (MazF antagonist)